VTVKRVETGDMAVPGTPLLEMESIEGAYIEADVDQGLGGVVRPGMPVVVRLDAPARTLKGSIRDVLPDVDPVTRTFRIKIDVPHTPLRSGLSCRVEIQTGQRQEVVVPKQAVVRRGHLSAVYVVGDSNLVTLRLIREGPLRDSGVVVLSGLAPGERIVTQGVEKAFDGGIAKESDR